VGEKLHIKHTNIWVKNQATVIMQEAYSAK
jgi:hypothetical protein